MVSTYSRQLEPGLKVLVRLASAKNIIDAHSLPGSDDTSGKSIDPKSEMIATLRRYVDAMADDTRKRAQIFLSFLSAKRLIRTPLYPLLDKLRQTLPLTDKDLTPLVNALCAALRKNGEISAGHKRKLRSYIQTGAYDTQTMLWLALFGSELEFVGTVLASYLERSQAAAQAKSATA